MCQKLLERIHNCGTIVYSVITTAQITPKRYLSTTSINPSRPDSGVPIFAVHPSSNHKPAMARYIPKAIAKSDKSSQLMLRKIFFSSFSSIKRQPHSLSGGRLFFSLGPKTPARRIAVPRGHGSQ